MVVAAQRRGLMLLISASPISGVVPSSPLSFLCRRSLWQPQQQPFGPVGSIVPSAATLSPSFGISAWVGNSTRSFHRPPAPEREGLEGSDEGCRVEDVRSSKKYRLGWKRAPVFGFPDAPPEWKGRKAQRNRRESAGSGHGNIWDGEAGGDSSSRSASNSADGAAVTFGGGPKTAKESREKENEGQRRSTSNQDLESGGGSARNGSSVQGEQNSGNSLVEKRRSPPFKPKANYFEKLAQSRGEGSESEAGGRPPFKPKANYYEKPAEAKGGGNSSQASGRPPFKPKADYYEKLAESKGGGNASQASGRPPLKPKANYYEKLAQSRGAEGDGRGAQGGERPSFKPKANYYDNRGKESFPKPSLNRPDPRKDNPEAGPHFGYTFRESGAELGQFRRIGPPPDRGSAVADSPGNRAQFQENGAVRERRSPHGSGRSSSNVKQNSPKEEPEVRKYPPRRLEGEKRWQYAVRKKQLGLAGHSRGATKKRVSEFVDDEELGNEPQGDDWRRKKTAWLCKEIPALRPRGIVTILNDQRKWINAEDTKYIIEHLLQIDQPLRAHRALKWEMQQPWYEFDYDLSSKVAVVLGQNNKLSRTRDIYDLIIKNGKVPDLSTYEVLINCYIVDGENMALVQAWSLYNQISRLGGHDPPPSLSYNLFQGLGKKGLTFLDQADDLFNRIKTSGLVCSTEMYSLLIYSHGTKGNNDRVDDLIKEMKEVGLPVGQDVYAAILRSCAKDGNVAVGEQAYTDLKLTRQKPIPSVFSSLIKMYGKAGLPEKAFQVFEEMGKAGAIPNLIVYEPIIEVAVMSGNRDQAERLLKLAQERSVPSLHSCYNSVMELYSKNGLLDELETLFNEMETKGYPPNQASFNVLLEAYVSRRLLEKAEAVYQTMKQAGKVKPNKRTYELMIKLYGEAKKPEQLKEMFKELADRKLDIPEESNRYLQAAVSPKHLEAHRNAKLRLKREQREILAGVLLAGAGVESHDRNRTYEFHFGLDPDNEVGLALINHLYDQFCDWSTGPLERKPMPDPRNPQKSKTLMGFQTVSHGSFRFFAHQYRPNRSPLIPRLVHRWLTPRALAYWYMYGGKRCPDTGDILLNASVYSDKSIMLVVNALKSRTIDCEKKKTSSGLAICFNGKSAIWLWGLMEPHILPEVKALLKPEDDQGSEDVMQQL